MKDFELVIVGGGLASARAIKSYRVEGGAGRILLVSKDNVLPYHRPPLSKRYLRGETEVVDGLRHRRTNAREQRLDFERPPRARALPG